MKKAKNPLSAKALRKNAAYDEINLGMSDAQAFLLRKSSISTATASEAKISFAFAFPTDMRMVRVAVAHCSPEDKFKHSVGREIALAKLAEGEFIQLPTCGFFSQNIALTKQEKAEEIASTLMHYFADLSFGGNENNL